MTVGQRALCGPPALPIYTTDSIGKLLSIFCDPGPSPDHGTTSCTCAGDQT